MIPPQLSGSPSYWRPGTPAIAKYLLDLHYHRLVGRPLGDHTAALRTAHGSQEYWGDLYHLDAMEQVSFPRHQQIADRAGGRATLQEHAYSWRPRRSWCRRSQDDTLLDASAQCPLVQVI